LVAQLQEQPDLWNDEHWALESGSGAAAEINERMADDPNFAELLLAEIEELE
jgi:hypothetical protein